MSKLGVVPSPEMMSAAPPMKVQIFRDLPEDDFMSMEVYADWLARSLSNLGAHRCRVHQSNPKEIGVPSALRRFPMASRLIRYYSRYVHYPRQARTQQADINHIIDQAYGHLVYHLDASRAVVTCHDLMPLKVEEGVIPASSPFRPGVCLAKYAYSGMAKASRIIAVSENTKADISRHLGYDPVRIKVIPYGINPKFGVVEDLSQLEAASKHYGLPRDGVQYVLHVGSTIAYKNIEGLLRAFSILVQSLSGKVFLVRVGEYLPKKHTHLAAQLGVAHRIVQLGYLPNDELVSVYNLADVLLFPSLYEGFGWPPLEAMACGTPAVISTAPSLLEVAGDAALGVAPNDHRGLAEAVQALLTNQNLRTRMIAKGLERAKMFSWERTAVETFEVYQEILDDKRASNGLRRM